ncbi:MAG: tetratricopeptide repeat protein [Fusobacteriota bacterium]
MSKKILTIISLVLIINSHILAGEREDIKYINRLNKEGYSEELVVEGEKFLKKYPDSEIRNSIINLVAYNHYKLGNYNKAYGGFSKLTDSEFKNEAHYFLLQISLRKGELYNIDKHLANIDSKNILKNNALYYVGNFFYKRKDYNESKKYFRELLKVEGDYTNLAFKKLGLIYYQNKEYIKATIVLEEYINNTENHDDEDLPVIYYVLGRSYERTKEYDSAIKNYDKLSEFPENQYSDVALYRKAVIYSQTNEPDMIASLVLKLEGTEYFEKTLLLLAKEEYNNENYSKAEKTFRKVLENDIENKDKIKYELIMSLLKQKKYDAAMVELKELKNTKYHGEYVYYTSYILNSQNEYAAILEFEKNLNLENVSDEYKKDTYISFAEAAYKNKEYNKALEYLNKLEGLKYIYRKIDIYIKQENTSKVIETMDEYAKKYKDDNTYKKEIVNMVGEFLIRVEKYSLAEKYYRDYLEKYKDEDVANNLVYALYEQDKYNEMITFLNSQRITEENLYVKGLAFLGLQDYENAEIVFRNLLKRDELKKKQRVYEKLITVLYNQEKYKNQIKITDEYIAEVNDADIVWALDKKGQAYFKLEEYDDAISVYEKLKKYDSVKDYAFLKLAQIQYNLGNDDKALSNYKHILNNFPSSEYHKQSLYWIITINWQLNKDDEAVEYINWFLKNYDTDDEYSGDIIYYLGNIYLKKDKPKLAIAEYEKVIDKVQDEGTKNRVRRELLKLYYDLEEFAEALSLIDNFEDENFQNYWKALVYKKQNKMDLAIENFKSLLKTEDFGDRASYNLGIIYFEKQNYSLAREYLSSVLDYDVSNYKDRAALHIGLSYGREGKYQEAINVLLKIRLIYVNSDLQDIALIKIAENYEKMGEIQKSIQSYIEFYNEFKDSQYYGTVLERLVQHYLEAENINEAQKYYNDLIDVKPEKEEIYENHFENQGGN